MTGLTLGHIIRYNAFRRSNKIGLVFEDDRYTYKEFNQRTNRLAAAFLNEGIEKGDVISILGFNSNQYLETYFACGKIGAIMNALNFRLAPPEIQRAISHSESKLVLVDAFWQPVIEQIYEELPCKGKVIPVIRGEPTVKNGVPYEEFIRDFSDSEPEVEVLPDDPILLQYTSGTTGLPKGVLLTHNSFVWDALGFLYHFDITSEDIVVQPMPFFHCGGLHILTDVALLKGMTFIIQNFWDARRFCENVQRYRATLAFVMMPVMNLFLEVLREGKYDLSSLRIIGSSAAPYSRELFSEILYLTGAKNIMFGYGLTEAAPSVSIFDTSGETLMKESGLGFPIWTQEVRIVDSEGNDVPTGEIGELIVKGPQLFKGYIKDEEATSNTLKNGWLFTGDLVRMDEDGCLFFIGRVKDMIKSGGENVYAEEVERAIMEANPEVLEVAVYGVPDPKWGEAVKASVILNPNTSLTTEELLSRTKKILAGFKVPKYVEFHEELPHTGSGKIAKWMLKKGK